MSGQGGKRGFALPSVLAVVAVVTLVFLVAILALDNLGDQTRRIVAQGRFETTAISLEAHAAFAAATGEPRPQGFLAPVETRDGLSLVIADGRPYRAAGGADVAVAVQDAAGLINLNALPASAMGRLFEALDVAVDRRGAMVDRLSDFLDADDLVRTDGAEASAYAARGLAPPPNGALRRAEQVLGVLGWSEAVPRQAWSRLRDDLVADPIADALNMNTASPAALRVLYGFDPAQVAAALAARERAPFSSLEAFGRSAGVRLSGDAERVYGFPNGRFLVKITTPRTGLAYRSQIILSPRDPERPLWIEAPILSAAAANPRADSLKDAPFFPDPAPGPADPGRPLRLR